MPIDNLDFHLAIAETSQNRLLRFLCEAFRATMDHTIRAIHRRWDLRDPDETVARHARIVEAIARNDPDAAVVAMNAHFDASIPVALAVISALRSEA